jgi:sec-independent protein translocase protein TatC
MRMSDDLEKEQDEGLQMSFLDHLDELRKRLINSALAIAAAFVLCFIFADHIYNFLEVPVQNEARKARLAREKKLLEQLPDNRAGLREGDLVQYTFPFNSIIEQTPIPAGTTINTRITMRENRPVAVLERAWVVGRKVIEAGHEVADVLGQAAAAPGFDYRDQLVLTGVAQGFSLDMKVALYAAVAFAIPYLLFQVWMFVSPGLYQHEKKYIAPVLVMGMAFFVAGAMFGYYIAFPAACTFLLGLHEGFQTLINAEDYLDLILIIMLGLGVIFQIPTISFILGRIGLVTPGMMIRAWRYAVVAIIIIAALLSPTTDAFNLLVFSAPMLLLYFFSIGIVWVFGKPRLTDQEVAALAAEK